MVSGGSCLLAIDKWAQVQNFAKSDFVWKFFFQAWITVVDKTEQLQVKNRWKIGNLGAPFGICFVLAIVAKILVVSLHQFFVKQLIDAVIDGLDILDTKGKLEKVGISSRLKLAIVASRNKWR